MFKSTTLLLTIVFCFSALNGCAIGVGYPSWKYRCYKVEIKPGEEVPAMPDCSENHKTLGGIDSDNDGVRDDIQRYIASIKNTSTFHKKALQQYARAERNAILQSEDPLNAQLNFSNTVFARQCVWAALVEQRFSYTDLISDLNRNTFRRRFADYKSRATLEVQLIPSLNSKDACDFDINQYEGERWK